MLTGSSRNVRVLRCGEWMAFEELVENEVLYEAGSGEAGTVRSTLQN